MTLNRPRSRSQDFSIKYVKYSERHNVGHNGGHIGNHWADTHSVEPISCLRSVYLQTVNMFYMSMTEIH